MLLSMLLAVLKENSFFLSLPMLREIKADQFVSSVKVKTKGSLSESIT